MYQRRVILVYAFLLLGLMAVAVRQGAWAGEDPADPATYAERYPLEYASYRKNADMAETRFGGSKPYSKLERYPWLKELYAGYGFSVEYNEDRGHVYSVEDVVNIKRKKPGGACWTCKSTDVPALLAKYGQDFYAKPFDALRPEVKHPIGCSDCHDPASWKLRLSRPALLEALKRQGKDIVNLPVSELRSLVCAQCHVEYYFQPQTQVVTFPWDRGLTPQAVNDYYDALGFADWTHPVSGTPLIKIQHPDYEFSQGGFHQQMGLACADCHMPKTTAADGRTYTSHWWTSPLKHVRESCGRCHGGALDQLPSRVEALQAGIQTRLQNAALLTIQAHQAIGEAAKKGAPDSALARARSLVRQAQLRVDWLAAENSGG
ncbi:MAG TPA: ammonia-forming cytochrome c nitrite reductase subunit c552, partial [Firmicutes bacterium]|nr:ammonia-forming cytochrome c nitrite reductase subunit c552 [Bacillota bacterium]